MYLIKPSRYQKPHKDPKIAMMLSPIKIRYSLYNADLIRQITGLCMALKTDALALNYPTSRKHLKRTNSRISERDPAATYLKQVVIERLLLKA